MASRKAKPARRYYVVDQVQRGLWYQVGHFATRAEAQRLQDRLSGKTEVRYTYPGHDYPPLRSREATATSRDAGRKSPRHPGRSQAEWISSLEWNIKDAKEALHNAVDMSDWRGVDKYTKQLHALEKKLYKARSHGERRRRSTTETAKEQQQRWATQQERFRTGRRGPP